MVNKKISNPTNRLLQINFQLFESQKIYLEKLSASTGKSISAILRDFITSQMSSRAPERAKLQEELRQIDAQRNIIAAQLKEIDEEDTKQQKDSQTRQALIEAIADRMTDHTAVIDFKERRFKQVFQTNLDDANKYLSGSCDPIKPEEIRQLILVKAAERGVVICE